MDLFRKGVVSSTALASLFITLGYGIVVDDVDRNAMDLVLVMASCSELFHRSCSPPLGYIYIMFTSNGHTSYGSLLQVASVLVTIVPIAVSNKNIRPNLTGRYA